GARRTCASWPPTPRRWPASRTPRRSPWCSTPAPSAEARTPPGATTALPAAGWPRPLRSRSRRAGWTRTSTAPNRATRPVTPPSCSPSCWPRRGWKSAASSPLVRRPAPLLSRGEETTPRGAAAAVEAEVRELAAELGFPEEALEDLEILDGSGLSPDNRVPPALLAAVLAQVSSGEAPRLEQILFDVPIAGL